MERYKVTNNLSGVFEIYGTHPGGREIKGETKLKVCQNYLKLVNYKGFATSGDRRVFTGFKIDEFFATYSSLFTQLPKHNEYLKGTGYSSDWERISLSVRERARYVCQDCRVDLFNHKSLLHVHHINGNKRDNRPENLRALCADCHKKQPHHQHMLVSYGDIQIIKKFRRQQHLHKVSEWDDAFALSDTAVHDLLECCRRAGRSVPEIGYEVVNHEGAVLAEFEIAWPNEKKGIYIDAEAAQNAKSIGWNIYSLGQAMKSFQ
ncbi:HNH endonuclease [Microbulbifer sp. PAAF003]|uniref:HNH endonuclease n=1 Tax=Microbulbifer sp. PAAF003 TaxID=3243375 RepID=UPI004039036A